MAFNDIPEVGKCYQQIPPNLLNSTERNAILLIVGHKNGCYIGEKALAEQVGTSSGNLRKVLGKLVKKGLVIRVEKKAHKGRQQCYRIDVSALQVLAERVSIKTPSNSVDITEADKGSREAVKAFFNSAYAYPVGHPYKEYKNNKNDKDERFSFITKDLPENVKAFIEYAPNVSELLDELELQGISLERIKGALEDTDFTNAYKVGGLFMSVLRGLRVSVAPIAEKPIEVYEPRKCDGCLESCTFNALTPEKFNEGYKCFIENSGTYQEMRKRNGLAP